MAPRRALQLHLRAPQQRARAAVWPQLRGMRGGGRRLLRGTGCQPPSSGASDGAARGGDAAGAAAAEAEAAAGAEMAPLFFELWWRRGRSATGSKRSAGALWAYMWPTPL